MQFINFQEPSGRTDNYYKLVALAPQNKYFYPDDTGGHCILDLKAVNIVEIAKVIIKVDAEVIMRDWDQRQMERFKGLTPGVKINKAVSELKKLNDNYIANPGYFKLFDLGKEIVVGDENQLAHMQYIDLLENELSTILPYTNVAGFQNDFNVVYEQKQLQRKIEELQFKNSNKNLSLYPDYCNKLKVLRDLAYIDNLDEGRLG